MGTVLTVVVTLAFILGIGFVIGHVEAWWTRLTQRNSTAEAIDDAASTAGAVVGTIVLKIVGGVMVVLGVACFVLLSQGFNVWLLIGGFLFVGYGGYLLWPGQNKWVFF